MKYSIKLLLSIIFLFLSIKIYSDKKTSISIAPPFIENSTAETIFINNHFTYELLFNYEKEDYILNIIESNTAYQSEEYLKYCKEQTILSGSDYLLYSNVFSNNDHFYFYVKLINPYSDSIVLSKLFIKKINIAINESVTEISNKIISILESKSLKIPEGKAIFNNIKENTINDNPIEFKKEKHKHELFVTNGFFKNHAAVISFLDIITGYNFSPFDFFSIEGGFFWGGGYISKYFELGKMSIDKFYLGTYGAVYFYLKNIVEPSLGLRVEFIYITPNLVYFTFPINLGLKIYINDKNFIRFDSSFQFISINFNTLNTLNLEDYTIGFTLGYGRKI